MQSLIVTDEAFAAAAA